MSRTLSANFSNKPPLRGPSVQCSDGSIVTPPPLDLARILADLKRLDAQERAAFLSIFAHDLTVHIRSVLMDRPVAEADLDRVNRLNEYLHQLTSCVNPTKRWSVGDEVALVRALAESSYQYGLQAAVGSALAKAGGNAAARKGYTISKANYSQVVAAYGEKIVEAELLRNGWLPANVNETVSNAAKFDIFAQKGDHIVAIQVKTCGPESDEFSFSHFAPDSAPGPNEFTVFVKMGKRRETDQIFVIPTRELHKDIGNFRDASIAAGIRDIRKWALRLYEPQRRTKEHRRYTYGFAQKWEKWLNNWQRLEAGVEADATQSRAEQGHASEATTR
jgi:hypothetical protein